MNLSTISGGGDILDTVGDFTMLLWLEEGEPLHDVFADPPPGIDPVEATVLSHGEPDEDGMIDAVVRMRLRDFIKNSVQYDMDPYEILQSVRDALGKEAAAAAVEYMKTGDFTVAVLGQDSVDNYPTKPNI